ncbi:uncharacterized protein KRP23_10855 [Phytophthora ramorum]|uniref:uncharacterized protein n=1 Tax=Phytophthora ramorum TaxID=164328 RepID=UPI0030B33209|nr:hypothetical protein KRP23_10855 [Phytophthora ramorum]
MSRDYLVERIAALVKMGRDLNAGELTSAAARYVIQVFWAKMLSVLVVNKFSTGMQYLGAVAYAHIEDDPADERRRFHCPATRTCDSAERGVDGPAETVEVEDEVTKSAEEEDEEEALERDNEEGSEATISPDATPSRGSSPRFTKSSPKLASKSSSKSK